MKIVVQGDKNRNLNSEQFTCRKCGCVFEATSAEYIYADGLASIHDGIYAQCVCPCCGATVFLYEEEGRKDDV